MSEGKFLGSVGHQTSIPVTVFTNENTGDKILDKERAETNNILRKLSRANNYLSKNDFFGGFIISGAMIDDFLSEVIKLKIEEGFQSSFFDVLKMTYEQKIKLLHRAQIIESGFYTILKKIGEIRNKFAHDDEFTFGEKQGTEFVDFVIKFLRSFNRQDKINSICEFKNKFSWQFDVGQAMRTIYELTTEMYFTQHRMHSRSNT